MNGWVFRLASGLIYAAGTVGAPVAKGEEVEDRLGIRAVRARALSRSGLRNVNLVRQNLCREQRQQHEH